MKKEPGTHNLTEAMQGQGGSASGDQGGHVPESGRPAATPREVAETTRREQEAQHSGKRDQDRDDHLVEIGRGQQTHG